MAKATVLLLFVLSILAALLFGISIGKKIANSPNKPATTPTQSLQPTPTLTPYPTNTTTQESGLTTFTNPSCGYQITYPQNWVKIESDTQSVGLDNPSATSSGKIAIICAANIPKPSISPQDIDNYRLGTVSAKLYHTTSQNGSPLDEIIAKIPGKKLEIAIAGFGPTLTTILNSFKFIP